MLKSTIQNTCFIIITVNTYIKYNTHIYNIKHALHVNEGEVWLVWGGIFVTNVKFNFTDSKCHIY